MPRNNNIQLRRGSYSEWDVQNTGVLGSGEPGFITDFNKLKIGDGSTQWSDLSAINDALTTLVYNNTANTIPKMSVVYINGAQGDMPTITLSLASGEMSSSKTFGITTSAIASNSIGQIVVDGALKNLNTLTQFSGVSPGTTLWLSPTVSGGITTTKPYAPYHVVSLGNLIRVHQNQGVINVRIQNGFELDELHNVAVTGVINNQYLIYQSGTQTWIPTSTGTFRNIIVDNTDNPTVDPLSITNYDGAHITMGYDNTIDIESYGATTNITATEGGSVYLKSLYGGNVEISTQYGATPGNVNINSEGLVAINSNAGSVSINNNGWTFDGDQLVNTAGGYLVITDLRSPYDYGGGAFSINIGDNTDLSHINWEILHDGNATFNNVTVNDQTANTIASFNNNKTLVSLATGTYPNLTELSYLKGTTSNLQDQLNSSTIVRTTGTQSISGYKTFTDALFASGSIFSFGGFSAFNDTSAGIITQYNTTTDAIRLWVDNIGSSNRVLTLTTPSTPLTADRTAIFPNADGTVLLDSTINSGSGISVVKSSGSVTINASGLQSALTNPVTGTGIANHIAYWNSSSGIIADSGQLYWDATNNRLGVGTSSPSVSLEVGGSIRQTWLGTDLQSAMIYDNSYRMGINYFANQRILNLFSTSNDSGGHLTFSTRLGAGSSSTDYGTERMRITSSGNIGIGTSTPSSQLHVIGSGIFASGINIGNQTSSAIASFDANKNIVSLSTSTYPSLTELSYAKGVTSSIQTQLNNKQSTLTNPVTGIGISGYSTRWISSSQISSGTIYDTSSSIGIGTNSPEKLLDVRGMAVFGDNSLGIGRMFFAENIFGGELGFMDDGDLTLALKMTDGSFQYGGGNPGTANIIVTSAGDVGVGTSSPSTKLEVNGVLKTGGFKSYTDSISWFGKADGSIGIAANVTPSGIFGSASDFAAFQGFNDGVTTYNPICFTTLYAPQLYLNTDGNVGIGTALPSGKLHVSGTQLIDGKLSIGVTSATVTPSSVLHINGQVSNYGSLIITGQPSSNTILGYGNSDTSPYFAVVNTDLTNGTYGWGMFYRGTEGDFRLSRKGGTTSWIDCLNIQRSNGYIGIGSGTQATAPPEMLTVDGHIRLADKASVGNKLQFYRGGGTVNDYTIGTEGNHLAISTSNDSTTNRYTEFGYHAAGTWTPKTRLNNYTGALGVNLTATPSGSLDVGGDVYVRNAANTSANIYLKSGSGIAENSCRINTDTFGNLYLNAGAQIRVGSQDGRIDMYASSQWITIGHTYNAGTANQYIRFIPANTEIMRMTSSGTIGIGTTTPVGTCRLTVVGSGTTSGTSALNVVDSGNSPLLFVRNDGNIGIGTSTPSSQLHVVGSGIFTSDVSVSGNLTFNSFTESVVAIGNSSTSKTLDLTSGTVQTCTLTGNCVFTMPTATAGKSFTLFLSTGAGSFTGTFTGVRWAGGTSPTITTTASKVDILSFISDGTYWYGSYSQNYG